MGIQMAITARAAKAGDRADEKRSKSSQLFGEIANSTSRAAGRAPTFVAAIAIVLIWAITGPLFGYSETWQLVINTSTTIVTFLMVFLIQNSQNRGRRGHSSKTGRVDPREYSSDFIRRD